jgi:hypothetical protein
MVTRALFTANETIDTRIFEAGRQVRAEKKMIEP